MIKVPYFTASGTAKENISLNIAKKYLVFNSELFAQVIRVEQSNLTQKSGKTKTKGEVRGGGRKPWKQKGTGRARAGSIRSPLFRGGGVTFGPSGESKKLKVPQKMHQLAYLQALAKRSNEFEVIEENKIATGKTKDAQAMLTKVVPSLKSILIYDPSEKDNNKPFKNLSYIQIVSVDCVKLQDLTKKGILLFTKKAFDQIQKKLENE